MIQVSRRVGVSAVAAATVLGVGLFAASSDAGEGRYRTATAATGDVEQTVTYDGTIAASNRSDLAFATSGTVRKVRASVGDEVEAGDVLATLDATDLRASVIAARADLADAEAYLDDVEDGQIDTVSRASGGSGATPSSASTSGTVTSALFTGTATMTVAASDDSLATRLAELKEQQEAVKTAQSDATAAIAAAKTALAAQQEACAEDIDTEDAEAAGLTPECRDALQAVQEAQDVVAQEQDELQAALVELGATLDEAVAQLAQDAESESEPEPEAEQQTPDRDSGTQEKTPTQPEQAKPDQQSAPQAKSGSAAPSGGSSGTTATAADLASAQADVDTAEAALASAEADLAAASLTAPFDGTVLAADVAAGSEVSTSDRAFVLVGDGDATATLSVPVDDLGALEVGQAATVTTATGASLGAEVSAIALQPDTSDDQSASTTYGVTVRIDDETSAPEGSAVSVAVVTGTAAGVVTVPSSAVTRRTATQGTALVLSDGEVERRQVTLGAVGSTAVAVTDGISAGEHVVVADLEAALPSSDSADTRSLTGGGRGGPPSGDRSGGRPPG